jgi:hypothetical protein
MVTRVCVMDVITRSVGPAENLYAITSPLTEQRRRHIHFLSSVTS